MLRDQIVDAVDQVVPIESTGQWLHGSVKDAFVDGGDAGKAAKDALQGKWLGHPLHPALTALPIGAWTTALVLDAAGMQRGADLATAFGLACAVAAGITGLADYSETDGEAMRAGTAHAVLNTTTAVVYTGSVIARAAGNRWAGVGLALAGYTLITISSYLGGEISYNLTSSAPAN